MKVLIIGGKNTKRLADAARVNLANTLDIEELEYITEIERYYSRGGIFDRAVIVEQGYTELSSDNTLEEDLNNFLECVTANSNQSVDIIIISNTKEGAINIVENTLGYKDIISVIENTDGKVTARRLVDWASRDISKFKTYFKVITLKDVQSLAVEAFEDEKEEVIAREIDLDNYEFGFETHERQEDTPDSFSEEQFKDMEYGEENFPDFGWSDESNGNTEEFNGDWGKVADALSESSFEEDASLGDELGLDDPVGLPNDTLNDEENCGNKSEKESYLESKESDIWVPNKELKPFDESFFGRSAEDKEFLDFLDNENKLKEDEEDKGYSELEAEDFLSGSEEDWNLSGILGEDSTENGDLQEYSGFNEEDFLNGTDENWEFGPVSKESAHERLFDGLMGGSETSEQTPENFFDTEELEEDASNGVQETFKDKLEDTPQPSTSPKEKLTAYDESSIVEMYQKEGSGSVKRGESETGSEGLGVKTEEASIPKNEVDTSKKNPDTSSKKIQLKKGLFNFGKKDKVKSEKSKPKNNSATPSKDLEALLKERFELFTKKAGVLVVTGSDGSGKTFVASNIANVANKLGLRVLVIDLDTHGRGQTYINSEIFLAVHASSMTSDGVTQAINNPEAIFGKYTGIVRKGYSVLGTGMDQDAKDPVECLDSSNIGKLLRRMQVDYNLIIIDAPFKLVTSTFTDLLVMSDNIIMVEEANSKGMASLSMNIMNIENEETAEMLFRQANLILNKYIPENLECLGASLGKNTSLLDTADFFIEAIHGVPFDYKFGEMHTLGNILYTNDIEKYWFTDRFYTDSIIGKGMFCELLAKLYKIDF